MPQGINRPASQTGTWPPLCMLDRRRGGCFGTQANPLQWLNSDVKQVDLERVHQQFPSLSTLDLHLLFCPPISQTLLIFNSGFSNLLSCPPSVFPCFAEHPAHPVYSGCLLGVRVSAFKEQSELTITVF